MRQLGAPSASRQRGTSEATSAVTARSAASGSTSVPSARNCAASASASPRERRKWIPIRQPRRAKSTASTRPMRREAPVMRTVRWHVWAVVKGCAEARHYATRWPQGATNGAIDHDHDYIEHVYIEHVLAPIAIALSPLVCRSTALPDRASFGSASRSSKGPSAFRCFVHCCYGLSTRWDGACITSFCRRRFPPSAGR